MLILNIGLGQEWKFYFILQWNKEGKKQEQLYLISTECGIPFTFTWTLEQHTLNDLTQLYEEILALQEVCLLVLFCVYLPTIIFVMLCYFPYQ